MACGINNAFNGLNAGTFKDSDSISTNGVDHSRSSIVQQAHQQVYSYYLAECTGSFRERREAAATLEAPPSGATAMANLSKNEVESYSSVAARHRQTPLMANLFAEPADPRCIPALMKLPPDLRDRRDAGYR